MLKEFKEFAMRGNVLNMAIEVIIGGALGKVVTSLVNDVLIPRIGLLAGRIDFSKLFVDLSGRPMPPSPKRPPFPPRNALIACPASR